MMMEDLKRGSRKSFNTPGSSTHSEGQMRKASLDGDTCEMEAHVSPLYSPRSSIQVTRVREGVCEYPLKETHELSVLSRQDLVRYADELVLELADMRRREEDGEKRVRRLEDRLAGLREENRELLWSRVLAPREARSVIPPVSDKIWETPHRVGRYAIGSELGSGSHAVVCECQDDEHVLHAIKIIDKSSIESYSALWRLEEEIRITRSVTHGNIVGVVEVLHTPNRLYIIQEHGGRDLFANFQKTDDAPMGRDEAKTVVAQLVDAAEALHACKVVHHDIKSENVLLGDRVRLGDFGMARDYSNGRPGRSCCGSPGFFAPEVILTREYDPYKVDIWGIGCVALELLMGRKWFAKTWLSHFNSLRKRDAQLAVFDAALPDLLRHVEQDMLASDMSFDAADFCLTALNPNPAQRPAATDLKSHPWVSSFKPRPPGQKASPSPFKKPGKPALESRRISVPLIPRLSGSISRLSTRASGFLKKARNSFRDSVNVVGDRDSYDSRASRGASPISSRRASRSLSIDERPRLVLAS